MTSAVLPNDEMIDALIRAMTPLLGIDIDPGWRTAIAANMKANLSAARLVLDFPLADELEPAAVFHA